MPSKQAALTATTIILRGKVDITIYRDREDDDCITLLVTNDEEDIIHEINVFGDDHCIDISKALGGLLNEI